MDILNFCPKDFLKYGFDHTVVSRWRSGKRRLMPGRHQAKTLARAFLEADRDDGGGIIDRLLHSWYPAEKYDTDEEKCSYLESFLTEKNQTSLEYQKVRSARLNSSLSGALDNGLSGSLGNSRGGGKGDGSSGDSSVDLDNGLSGGLENSRVGGKGDGLSGGLDNSLSGGLENSRGSSMGCRLCGSLDNGLGDGLDNGLGSSKKSLWAVPRGIEAVRIGLLDFLDLIGKFPEPQQMSFVFTEGLSMYLDEAYFGQLFMGKFMKLFEKGHRMFVAMRSDRAISDAWYFHKIKLYAHMKGYIKTLYYADFLPQGKDKLLGLAGDKLSIKVTRESLWDVENARVDIRNDLETAADIKKQIQGFASRGRPFAHYDYLNEPKGLLQNVNIYKDQPSYVFSRLPHFGVAAPKAFAECFALSGDELDAIQNEFFPLLLDPSYFNDDIPVRHIFCEDDINSMLMKKRHQSHELSAMIGRKAWMSTAYLVRQLKAIQALLKAHKNYEACFVKREDFSKLMIQIGVWGNEAVICWLDEKYSVACKEYLIVTGLLGYCFREWNEIPNNVKNRHAVSRKLAQWVKAR